MISVAVVADTDPNIQSVSTRLRIRFTLIRISNTAYNKDFFKLIVLLLVPHVLADAGALHPGLHQDVLRTELVQRPGEQYPANQENTHFFTNDN